MNKKNTPAKYFYDKVFSGNRSKGYLALAKFLTVKQSSS